MYILLVNPAEPDPEYVTEHLGIASLLAMAKANGFEADMYDMALEVVSVAEAITNILHISPDCVGVSLVDATKDRGLLLISGLRDSGYAGHIIVGGYFATFAAKNILANISGVDFVIRGEGEETLIALLEYLRSPHQDQLKEIQGISYRLNSNIIENPSRPLINHIDKIPFVDRKYASQVLTRGANLRVYASRGCWGKCSFCDIVALYGTGRGKVWRRRSVELLLDEIQDLMQTYDTDYFIFNDDQFLVKGAKALLYIEEFAAEIERRNLIFKFELMCRADTVNRKVISRLQQVGLQRVFLGLESFDADQLKRYNKGISVKQNLRAVITLYRLNVDVIASIILADAYTSIVDLLKQFIFLDELRRRYFNSSKCRISINKKLEIYRGSALYKEYKTNGLLTRDDFNLGYDFNLKWTTAFRIYLLSIEEKVWIFIRNFYRKITLLVTGKYF